MDISATIHAYIFYCQYVFAGRITFFGLHIAVLSIDIIVKADIDIDGGTT
jgi:hypothetical protein